VTHYTRLDLDEKGFATVLRVGKIPASDFAANCSSTGLRARSRCGMVER